MQCSRRTHIWKGAVAGMFGGLIASWTMNAFQAEMTSLMEMARTDGKQRPQGRQGDDATVKVASAVSESVAGHALTRQEKKMAGPIVHYAFGSAMGALYGVATELAPTTASGFGLAFGSALWFGADEVAVPVAGLSAPPDEISAGTHVSAYAMHVVYGLTLEGVRRFVRAVL